MAGFSLNNFRADINRRGIMRTNRASLVFSPPRLLNGDARAVALRCESLQLPAVSFTTSDHQRYGIGPIDQVAGQPMFEPLSMSFIVERSGGMFRFFYDWAMLQSTFNSVGGGRYEGEYQEDYVTDMLLLVFDETQHQVMEYRLLNANVKSIEAIDMNWGDQDQLVRLSVTFNYREWHLKTADTTLYSQVNDIIASVDKVLGRSIRIPTGVLDVISLF